MSKINLPDITTQFESQQGLNNRFQQIEDEFNDKVLYRDNPGNEPNEMSNDLDMNTNDILNAGTINADVISVTTLDFAGVSIAADEVTFDNTGTAVVGTELQTATEEIDSRTTDNNISSSTNSSNISAMQAQIATLEAIVDRLGVADTGGSSASSLTDLAVRRKGETDLTSVLPGSGGADKDLGDSLGTSSFMIENIGTVLFDLTIVGGDIDLSTALNP